MIEQEILDLINKAIREKWTAQKLEIELTKLLMKMRYDELKIKQIKQKLNAMLEQIGAFTLGVVSIEDVTRIINNYNWKMMKHTHDLRRKLVKSFIKHKDAIDYTELYNEIKSHITTKKHYTNTIIRTTFAGIDQLRNISKAVEKSKGREPLFRYVGPPAERPFCRERLGKVYKLSEIKAMDNGQGLPVITNCGGYNCRHHWVFEGYEQVQK